MAMEVAPEAGEGLRERLVRAAVGMIEKVKEDGLSLREVARACGVSHNAPYRHFESREHLLLPVATQGFRWLTERFEAEEPLSLARIGEIYVSFAMERPEMVRLMFRPWADCGQEGSELTEAARDAFLVLRRTVARAHPQLDETGVGRSAIGAWSIFHGYAVLSRDGAFGFVLPEELPGAAELGGMLGPVSGGEKLPPAGTNRDPSLGIAGEDAPPNGIG